MALLGHVIFAADLNPPDHLLLFLWNFHLELAACCMSANYVVAC